MGKAWKRRKKGAFRPLARRGFRGLPIAQRFPPQRADDAEDEHVDHAHGKAGLPPLAQRDVAGAEDDRRRAGGVVGEGHHHAGGGGHEQGHEHGRRAQRHARAQKGGEHGADVRRGAGEHVVRIHIGQREQRAGGDAAQAQMPDGVFERAGKPGDQPQLVEKAGHHHQRGKPHHRVPGAFFLEHVVPGQRAGEQKQRQADEGRGRGVDCPGRPQQPGRHARPQKQQQGKDGEHDFFVRAHGAHFGQALAGEGGGVGRVLDLGRVEQIQRQRHEGKGQQAGREHGDGPLAPAQLKVAAHGFGDEVDDQRVGRGGGDEHGRADGVAVVVGQRQVAADAPLRAALGDIS